ncbi:MAG: hypothetical protein ACI4J2_05580 [Ruminococcus sp.]
MAMNQEQKKLLKQFQCEKNRQYEETFAQIFSEDPKVRLFFVNENQAFTDGRNIVVDPASDSLFYDIPALQNTEKVLKIPHTFSRNPWYALYMITRGQTLHECLHILYTDMPGAYVTDPLCDTHIKKKVMAYISNVVEDAYIEAAGCSVFDNLEVFLQFHRIARLFAANPSKGTINRAFAEELKLDKEKNHDAKILKTVLFMAYMNHMITLLLYPMLNPKEPMKEIAPYVEQTKQLFFNGSMAPSPTERYACCQKIFKIILPIIPEDEKSFMQYETWFEKLLGGCQTHTPDAIGIGQKERKGRTQTVTIRLFTNADGTKQNSATLQTQLELSLKEFEAQQGVILLLFSDTSSNICFPASRLNGNIVHNPIQINEIKPNINWNNQKIYTEIRNSFQSVLRTYQTRFSQILKAKTEIREEHLTFGTGINTKKFSDPRKRYWYRIIPGEAVPELSVMLLVDGSGSMHGERIQSAMQASLILHEVLEAQNIPHAIAEHRAQFEQPEVDINILVDFNAAKNEKYNLIEMAAYGDNRDALALLWAEQYMYRHTQTEERLLIVISDGVPAHEFDAYYPPLSVADTAETVRKICSRGTHIIGIALDASDSFDCYDALKEIYPQLISCNVLSQLTKQVLTVVSRFFS